VWGKRKDDDEPTLTRTGGREVKGLRGDLSEPHPKIDQWEEGGRGRGGHEGGRRGKKDIVQVEKSRERLHLPGTTGEGSHRRSHVIKL